MALKRNARSSDLFQTPKKQWIVEQLLAHVKEGSTVWECASGQGNLAAIIEDYGYNVIRSDIENGVDFLNSTTWTKEMENSDYIITNPPFSAKDKFLETCYKTGKPFALLMPHYCIAEQKRMELYAKYGAPKIIYPPARINFHPPLKEIEKSSGSQFFCMWFTGNGFMEEFHEYPNSKTIDLYEIDKKEIKK